MAYRALYRFLAFIIRAIFRINGGLEVRGIENIPEDKGVLIASNHVSYLDPPLLGAIIPRISTFMARKGLFDIPVLGWMIKPAAIPVDRQRTRPSTIKEVVRRLRNNELIVMFPEGRRSKTGELTKARRGVGMVVSLAKVPVVPAVIKGTEKILPVGAKWIKRAKASVVFGKPIDYDTFAGVIGNDPHQIHEEISNRVMDAIREIKGSC